jgi:hypothetical protein
MTNKQQTTDTEEVWGNIELPGFGDDKLMAANLNKRLASMAKAKDPVWRANQKLGAEKRSADPEWQANIEKRSADPEWQANTKLANQLKAQDPEWHANQKLGCQKRSADPEWQANVKSANQLKAQDPEWQASMKLASEKRKEIYKDPTKCPNYKGAVIGIHMETGEIIMLCGKREMKAAGFNCGNISSCINGRKKHYKKYIWTRDKPT